MKKMINTQRIENRNSSNIIFFGFNPFNSIVKNNMEKYKKWEKPK